MRRLIWAFAGRTYHIVGNLISRLNSMRLLLRGGGEDKEYSGLYVVYYKNKIQFWIDKHA